MWRVVFLALGAILLILGIESLAVDHVVVASDSFARTKVAGGTGGARTGRVWLRGRDSNCESAYHEEGGSSGLGALEHDFIWGRDSALLVVLELWFWRVAG